LEEENRRLMTENEILKEKEICKQELLDEYKTRSKSVEEKIQRAKDEFQRFRDEISSLKEEKIAITIENEYLKRRDEELRLDRTAERAMFQTMISSLMNGLEDRKRKRNEDQVESS
jgi:FtsZ-binding cell division protein ZapB